MLSGLVIPTPSMLSGLVIPTPSAAEESASPLSCRHPKSVHDRLRQVMRPRGSVIRKPKPRIDLRDQNLVFRRALLVDLLAQQRGRVNAVRTDFHFPCAVARNQRVAVDGIF